MKLNNNQISIKLKEENSRKNMIKIEIIDNAIGIK